MKYGSSAILSRIERDFANGWHGSADKWWAENPDITTINSIAPHFTALKQEGRIRKVGVERTRHGGVATTFEASR